MVKMCCTCKEVKDISNFSKNKNSKDGYKQYCKECANKASKKYREENKEKIKESKKEWYYKTKENKNERTQKEIDKGYRVCTVCNIKKDISEFYKRGNGGFYGECKECQLKKQKEYHLKNRDKIILNKREYNKRRKEEIHDYNKKYYTKNSEDIKNRVKIWCKNNPEKLRDLRRRCIHIRNARKRLLISNFSKKDWEECKEYFKNENGILECAYCGKELKRATQEHFIPLSKGGNYTKNNIIPVCGSCNSSKCDKEFEEWYSTRNFYSEERKEKIYNYLNKQANTVPSHCENNERSRD